MASLSVIARALGGLLVAGLVACSGSSGDAPSSGAPVAFADTSFTLAVIPDTQNYIDYRRQSDSGFAIDAADLFLEQMRFVANGSVAAGGDIAFVASVGDVWQHQSKAIDPQHHSRGIAANPEFDELFNAYFPPRPETQNFELPKAIEGYQILSDAGLPFGVAPGNHDFDAVWSAINLSAESGPANTDDNSNKVQFGVLHAGGLNNFRSVFGADQAFFKNKDWYIDSHNGGASSAQIFSGADYQFLHITLEMQAGDATIEWAESVLQQHRNLPTIITTHDYLNAHGERRAKPLIDLSALDPEENNSPQQLWDKFISQHDQIFLVLCGHHHGQNFRVDENVNGLPVYQILADYQDRGQAAIEAGVELDAQDLPVGIGDGWLRLMRFDLNSASPVIRVHTYSTYFNEYSSKLINYANWYRYLEQPDMTDSEFYQADEFIVDLQGFHERFR